MNYRVKNPSLPGIGKGILVEKGKRKKKKDFVRKKEAGRRERRKKNYDRVGRVSCWAIGLRKAPAQARSRAGTNRTGNISFSRYPHKDKRASRDS